MTCTDVQQALPDIMDGSEDAEFQAHLKSCPVCAELVADLNLIVSEARDLPESDEPPARVWVQIANQLRAEGIIRDAETVPGRPVLVPAPGRRWNAWWLAPVAAAVIAAGAYQLTHKQTEPAQVSQQPTAQNTQIGTGSQAPQLPQSASRSTDSQSTDSTTPSGHLPQIQASNATASSVPTFGKSQQTIRRSRRTSAQNERRSLPPALRINVS